VPIAGKYRLVDIPISNCIRSGLREMYLLTMFNSVSLHEHIVNSYTFDQFQGGFIRILAAQQTPNSSAWYEGTADAVRQTFAYFMDIHPDLIVILSGDQLYKMNYADMIKRHLDTGAEVTISTKPVDRREAGSLGIMKVDAEHRITTFLEKPGSGDGLEGYQAPMYEGELFLASMGIYVFNTPVLKELLSTDLIDFGKDIIPSAIQQRKVFSYIYDGYWKDIGTIRSFWETNLSLTDLVPEFDLHDRQMPIYTHARFLPPSKVNRCEMDRCLLSEGCIVSGERISHSVVGIRSVVGEGTIIEDTVMMGSDYYQNEPGAGDESQPLGIGKDCVIQRAIVDKNARIGDGCHISPDAKPADLETDLYVIRDGVLVIPKNTVIPSGTRL
jgi:glucose-1-phosphate adenylyltransferase